MYNFSDILGHKQVIANLQGSVRENRLNHAYIIDGAGGSGKRTIANAFAKTLNCEQNGVDGCNECLSCRTFDEGNNPDIIYITHEKKQIGVDDIRKQIIENLSFAPYKHKYKIYIMPEADKMNINAQNALLKSLEEPPSYAVFILLCENANMLISTIHSRCVMLRLMPIDERLVEKYLVDNRLTDEQGAKLYSRYSMGSIGRAVELCTSDKFNDIRQKANDTVGAVEKADLIGLYSILEGLKAYKDDIDEVLEIMYLLYRDALVYKSTGDKKRIIEAESSELIAGLAKNTLKRQLIKRCEAIQETRVRLMQHGSFDLMLETMLFKLKEK